jgi:hypothetical protein
MTNSFVAIKGLFTDLPRSGKTLTELAAPRSTALHASHQTAPIRRTMF